MKPRVVIIFGVILVATTVHAQQTATVSVAGTANPWLAGMPDGSVDGDGYDTAPAESPVQVPIPIVAGSVLTFSASGSVSIDPSQPLTNSPDGDAGTIWSRIPGAENGIANVTAPRCALVGVFLDDNIPSQFSPPAALNFSTAAERNFLTLQPALRQPFFIGDGLRSGGVFQKFVVPAGATRLFLGTMDEYGWYNNTGSFAVTVNDPASLNNGLLAWYPFFDGNANDASGNGNNATAYGSPTYEPGPVNYAACLDGIQDYFTCPINLNLYTNVTIAFWLNLTSYPQDDRDQLVSNDNGDFGRVINLAGDTAGDTGSLDIYWSGGGNTNISQPLKLNTWYHIAGVWTPNSTTLYLDGSGVISEPGAAPTGNDRTSVFVGYPTWGPGTPSDYTHGCFCDLRIYNRALSSTDIQQLAAQRTNQITGLFNTGVDNNNNLLPPGSVDPHYTLISSADPNAPGPSAYVADTAIVNSNYPGAWPNGATSQWIAPSSDASGLPGDYVYRTTFDLSNYDTNSISISGTWWVDNWGINIKLNGNSTGINYFDTSTSIPASFTLTNGFINGLNTLDFVISNNVGLVYNPTGLRVELSGVGVPLSSEPPRVTKINVGPVPGGLFQSPNLAMAIQGNGFGTTNGVQDALTNLIVYDINPTTGATNWTAGGVGDLDTINVTNWTDNEIDITSFNLPTGDHFSSGDQVMVQVQNPQIQSGFVAKTVLLNQTYLKIDIQPSTVYPLVISDKEMAALFASLTNQLRQEGLFSPNSGGMIADVQPTGAQLTLDVLSYLAFAAPDALAENGGGNLLELGAWGVAANGTDLGSQIAQAWPSGTQTSASGNLILSVFYAAQMIYEAEYLTYSCYSFPGTSTPSEHDVVDFVVVNGNELQLIIPLSSTPTGPIDLQNVLANWNWGVGDIRDDAVLGLSGTEGLEETACGANGVGIGLKVNEYSYTFPTIFSSTNGHPVFSASTLDFFGNNLGTNVLVPNGPPPFTIATSASPSWDGETSGGGGAYSNSTVTLTATPNPGYSFSSWSSKNIIVTFLPTYTFTPTNSETLVANFTTNIYTINTTNSPSTAGAVTGGTNAPYGTSITVVASPFLGYSFADWTTTDGIYLSSSSNYTFTVETNVNLVANFVSVGSSMIATVASPTSAGSTSGGGAYTNGVTATLTAAPTRCYSFVKWTANGVQISTLATNTITVTTNQVFVANFAPISYNIAVSASAGGSASGGGAYDCGTLANVSAVPDAGYTFVNWTEIGSPVSRFPDYSFVVDTNYALVANFTPITYNVTTSSLPLDGGVTSGGGTVNWGASVTVTAMPTNGYMFLDWTENGMVVTNSPSYTFTAASNRALVANFVPNVPVLGFNSPPWNSNLFNLMLFGPIGSNYEVDFSTDLLTWLPTTNFITTNSPFYFSVPAPTNSNEGFYRAEMP